MPVLQRTAIAFAFVMLSAGAATASMSNIYIAQSAAGAANGADCEDALAVTFFNTAANWGTGAAQIGPGTTVHLCGTFTGSAGATELTIRGSGASGNPVVVQFESGAKLEAPYWSTSGAIACSGQDYITIDGNNVGSIENSNNGTDLTYQNASDGIVFSSCSNVEVKNLTVDNLYQRVNDTSSNGVNTYAIYFGPGCNHIKVDGDTVFMSRDLIFVAYSTATDVQIFNNTLDHSSWMIVLGDNNTNSSLSGTYIFANLLGPHFNEWLDTAQTMHGDGIMVFAANSGSTATAQIYNNYIQSDMCSTSGVNCTGYIYVQGNAGTDIFNNVLLNTTSSGPGPEAQVVIRGNSPGPAPSNNSVYNNAFVGFPQTTAIKNGGGLVGTGLTIENNIFSSVGYGYVIGPNSLGSIGAANNNDFYGVGTIAADNADSGPDNTFVTLASWQTQGFDASSTTGNPNLSASYVPQSGSAAVGRGANLTSLGITALDKDKAGVARAPSGVVCVIGIPGCWDAGAYQETLTAVGPAAPTLLTASAH